MVADAVAVEPVSTSEFRESEGIFGIFREFGRNRPI